MKKRTILSWISILGLLIALAASLRPGSAALGQEQVWSEAVQLGVGWFPDIVADPAGRVHVAWASTIRLDREIFPRPTGEPALGYDVVMYSTIVEGQPPTDPTDIAALRQRSGSEVTRPALLVDSNGILHMAYRDLAVYYTQSLARQAETAKNWRSPTLVSVDQVAYFSRLGIDSTGNIHLLFTENVMSPSCSICYHLFYRRSDDNGLNWSPRYDISSLPTGSSKPQILVDSQDKLHVVWEAGRGGSYGQLTDPTTVMYASSTDGGTTWTRPVEFFIPNGRAKNITIGEDGGGRLVIAWLALPEDRVYYQVSSNQGLRWSDPQPIEGIWGGYSAYRTNLDDYAMATDSAGNIHLVLVGRVTEDQRDLSLIHLTWDGRAWSEPDIAHTITGDVPEWPRLAINNGNELHLTWFVRDQAHIFESDRGQYTVWYASRPLAAPRIAPVVLPTATAPPQPTASVLLSEPSQTSVLLDPSLLATPSPKTIADSLYTELDEMFIVAQALLPAAAFIFLSLVIHRLRKR